MTIAASLGTNQQFTAHPAGHTIEKLGIGVRSYLKIEGETTGFVLGWCVSRYASYDQIYYSYHLLFRHSAHVENSYGGSHYLLRIVMR